MDSDIIYCFDFENFCVEDYYVRNLDNKKCVPYTYTEVNTERFYKIMNSIQNDFKQLACAFRRMEYSDSFDFEESKVNSSSKGLYGRDIGIIKELAIDGDDFLQWLKWIEKGKLYYSKNLPYVEVLFFFVINGLIFSDEPIKALVLLCNIWNHYFDPDFREPASRLYLEWIICYWEFMCSDCIDYNSFSMLLVVQPEFEKRVEISIPSEHYTIDISKMDSKKLLDFYNRNCDYHVLDSKIFKYGNHHKRYLEKSIEAVHEALTKLWDEYNLKFEDYIYYEERDVVYYDREVFYRAVLLPETIDYLRNKFENQKYMMKEFFVGSEYYYDDKINRPVFRCRQYITHNKSSRMLLDYIIRQTEMILRNHLKISNNFRFDEQRLYTLFPNTLFEDNLKKGVIRNAIREAVETKVVPFIYYL